MCNSVEDILFLRRRIFLVGKLSLTLHCPWKLICPQTSILPTLSYFANKPHYTYKLITWSPNDRCESVAQSSPKVHSPCYVLYFLQPFPSTSFPPEWELSNPSIGGSLGNTALKYSDGAFWQTMIIFTFCANLDFICTDSGFELKLRRETNQGKLGH